MSSLFIDPTAYDPVYDDDDLKTNVVYIRHKMGFGTRSRLQDELYKISMKAADMQDGAENMEFRIGIQLQELLLAIYNIVDWQGPRFMKPKQRQKRDEGGKLVTDQKGDPIMETVTDDEGNPILIPIPCTRANIELINPHDPFLAKVLTRISANNQPRTETKPKGGTAENGPLEESPPKKAPAKNT